ncbi:MAG: BamA/TamA family outer membrane protein [Bacteroidales bacterium]|nr:BamA/TamA family outer membrane protein [Bacteroidales bacterium]
MRSIDKSISVIFMVVFTAWLLCSCSTTRRLEEGEVLYTGLKKVEYVTDSATRLSSDLKEEIHDNVFVAPNNYWKLLNWHYPFPLGLWVYNNWPNPEKGFRHWLYEKLAADPVLLSDVRPEVRTKMAEQTLQNNGYFRGKATYTLYPSKSNKRKASVGYTVYPGPAFRFGKFEYLPDTSQVNTLINSIAERDGYLRSGKQYSVDSLSAARIRITNELRTRGYYYFTPDFIEYLADTVATPGEIQMRMVLGSNMPKSVIEPYRTGKVRIYIDRPNHRSRQEPDTIELPRMTIIRQMPTRLRKGTVSGNVTFRPGKIFSVRDMDRTQSYLSRLGIFSSVSINAIADTTSAARLLDVDVFCTLDKPLEASIEVNASSKSNSYLGPGITLGLTNRNIFGGGEQLAVKLTGSYEWQTGSSNKGGVFNSYEVSLTTSLSFPRLLAPRFIPRRRRQINWTRFSINADLLNRPHYFKMAQFNMGMSYDWLATRHVNMSFTPLKLTYTKLMHTTHDFDSIMAANPAVAQSFMSQFIPQMQYSYVYDRQFGRDNRLNFSFTVQEAGNLFWSIYQLAGKHGEKTLFGTPFAQFVKGQTQLVYSYRTGPGDSWLVTRAAVGAAHAYGNSSQVPYAEQFYCGGANSVRAFTVRSLGPGSYRPPHATSSDYFDQTGTFKFEANMEYRFPIAGPLHGALFLDAGNVWLLKEDPQRPGGKLKASTFLKDLALGTGLGLRVDIGMLVVRGDLGIGIHAPYDTGKRGYYNMTSFGKSLAFHLAIGYPF